jgi:hypothetical protein
MRSCEIFAFAIDVAVNTNPSLICEAVRKYQPPIASITAVAAMNI